MNDASGIIQLSPDQLAQIRERAEGDLFYFAKGILNYNYLDEDFHGPICAFLQDPKRQRKLVALPRGHFKTTVGTISYSIWRAVKDPNIRILISNATATNAEKFLEAIKTQFESNGLLRALWPEVIPDIGKVRWNNTAVELKRDKPWTEATFEAIGVGGHVASRHYDLIVKDDLIDLSDKQDMDDVAQLIQTAVAWHQYSYGLFVNVENGEELVIGTRWHRDDLIAWIKKNQVDKLEETSSMRFHSYEHAIRGVDPIFKRSADGKHGFTREGLDHLRRTLGPYKYSGQYQLNPSDPSVAEFQRTWLRYYSLSDDGRIVLPGVVSARGGDVAYGVGQLDRYVLVDPALSKKRKADYTGLVAVGVTPGAYKVVLEASDLKAEPLELIEAIIAATERWKPICVGIEAVAFQKMIKPFLEFVARSRGKFVPVREFKTDTRVSKENRIRSLVPEFARGMIFISASMGELESEYDGFPVASDQHLLDALAYGPQLWQSGEPLSDEELAEARFEEELALAGRSELTGY